MVVLEVRGRLGLQNLTLCSCVKGLDSEFGWCTIDTAEVV